METSLPLPVRLAALGIVATVSLVIAAVALRTPPYLALEEDAGDPSTSASSRAPAPAGTPSTRPSAVAADKSTARPTAPPSASPPPATADGREARATLRKEIQFGRYGSATTALAHLVEVDPRCAQDGEVREDIVELAQRVMLLTGDEPDRVFDLITHRMGTTGIDILYELVTTRGGSRAASRADELLRDDKVRALGTPAVRIAYELRTTSDCDQKKALFPRAKTDGDGRTLGQLQLLNRRCGRHATACCLQNDPVLRETMDAIKARSN